jgi:hypothetical protein
MAAFATPTDVAIRMLTSFTAEETLQAQALLDDASSELRTRRPLIDTWITSGDVSAGQAKKICCEAVMAYLNGAGVGIESRAHPELSDRYTSAASSGISFTEDQLNSVTPDVKESRPFSIRPKGDD